MTKDRLFGVGMVLIDGIGLVRLLPVVVLDEDEGREGWVACGDTIGEGDEREEEGGRGEGIEGIVEE